MVRVMCRVQLKHRAIDLMLMLDLNETVDHLAMANCGHWYCHVLRTEDGHILRRGLDFEVEERMLG